MTVLLAMSAIGTKRTSLVAAHMSAFGGRADIANSVLRLPTKKRVSRYVQQRHAARDPPAHFAPHNRPNRVTLGDAARVAGAVFSAAPATAQPKPCQQRP